MQASVVLQEMAPVCQNAQHLVRDHYGSLEIKYSKENKVKSVPV